MISSVSRSRNCTGCKATCMAGFARPGAGRGDGAAQRPGRQRSAVRGWPAATHAVCRRLAVGARVLPRVTGRKPSFRRRPRRKATAPPLAIFVKARRGWWRKASKQGGGDPSRAAACNGTGRPEHGARQRAQATMRGPAAGQHVAAEPSALIPQACILRPQSTRHVRDRGARPDPDRQRQRVSSAPAYISRSSACGATWQTPWRSGSIGCKLKSEPNKSIHTCNVHRNRIS